ncbi:ATP-dependent RNA helicase RhlE [Nymphon striatum]|nr:ATP-dependent RNA helicase RhlE [Nymphon striatum]
MKNTPAKADFKSFTLSPSIYSAIEEAGFKEPTDVQQDSIPAILNGKDVLARAETGSVYLVALKLNPQMIALRGGADVLVATPGRLLDLEKNNAILVASSENLGDRRS